MLRVIFMGTPEFAVPALEAVHSCHTIVGVYTQPDRPVGRGIDLNASPVKEKALELGLPVFQPDKLSALGEFERLQSLQPDIIVIVAYGQILRRNVLDLPRLGCVNIHSSLLPRWRGAAPIQWSILGGDSQSGITTMRLVEKLDAGDILMQSHTPISQEDTSQTLHDRLAKIGADLILPTLEGLETGKLKGIVQDESQVTYATKLTKEMEWLDPNEPAEVLDRRIRALFPWPGTCVGIPVAAATENASGTPQVQRLKIKRAKLHKEIQGPQGKIFDRAGMVMLGTPRGSIELLSVQWDGKKEVDSAGFVNGLKGRGQSLPLTVQVPPSPMK